MLNVGQKVSELRRLSLEVEVLRDGEVFESGPALAARHDSLALANSVSKAPLKFYGSQNFRAVPAESTGDPAELARWSLRVRGTSEYVLSIWEATQRWGGELTIPLAEAIRHDRERAGSGGRGPETSTPRLR